MRLLAKILVLYIVGLAIYPCTDSLHQHFTQSVKVCDKQEHQQSPNDKKSDEPHSPLCSCKCHHQHTTVKDPLNHLAVKRFSVRLPIQNTQSLLNYNPTLFHPPVG
jgi:ABC-type nickel/cobalt efflux system permease component RcnA